MTVISLAVLCGCDRTFDIAKQVGDSTIWMTFIPSNEYDSTYFYVQATTPLFGKAEPVTTAGESVEVRVNGQTLTLKKSRSRSIPDRMQCYVTGHVFQPGDVVETSASVAGIGTVEASCEVPEPFPSYTWNARVVKRPNKRSMTQVDIEYDDPGDGGYYGAIIRQYVETDEQYQSRDPETGEMIWGEVQHSAGTAYLTPCAMADTDGLSAGSEDPVIAIPRYYNFLSNKSRERIVQIWSDASSPSQKDSRRRMTLTSYNLADSGRMDYTDGEYHGWVERSIKYSLVFYRFSESYYNYLKARYNSDHNDFSSLGMAPASFVYTNVSGGAGVCGAYVVSETDWIELDD